VDAAGQANERTPVNDTIRALQNEFDEAELEADAETLQRLLCEDFLSIGPRGFVLDKQEWIGRHVHFTYHALDVSDMDIRMYDDAAIVRTIQRNKASYKTENVHLAVRVTQVWVRQKDEWRMAGIHFSPLAEG
jgi:hypothetical protein